MRPMIKMLQQAIVNTLETNQEIESFSRGMQSTSRATGDTKKSHVDKPKPKKTGIKSESPGRGLVLVSCATEPAGHKLRGLKQCKLMALQFWRSEAPDGSRWATVEACRGRVTLRRPRRGRCPRLVQLLRAPALLGWRAPPVFRASNARARFPHVESP